MRRRYEGRPLARPDEELVDQGLAFDLDTLLSRRTVLRGSLLGAAALGLAACGGGSTSPGTPGTSAPASASASTGAAAAATAEIPDETAGPYPGDGSNGPNVLDQSGIVRRDLRSSFGDASGTAEGVPLTVELTLTDLAAGGPFAGAAVYLWHCDAEGRYSLYSDGVTGENYLRGVQVADAAGTVSFTSVFPACYPGRWPHLHLEVYPDRASISDTAAVVATSQVALPQDACEAVYATSAYASSARTLSQVSLAGDGVFGEDDGALQLGTVTGSVGRGFTVALAVGVDTRTAPTGGRFGGQGRPAGAPPAR